MSSQSWYSCDFLLLLCLVDAPMLSNPVCSGSSLPKPAQDHKVSICITQSQIHLFNQHWCASVLNKRFKTPFRDGIWNCRQVSVGDRGSFPHDPETVGDRAPTVLLLISARIAIAVGILWCYVYDARLITNGSLL